MLMRPSLRARMDIIEIIKIFSYNGTDLYRKFCINKSNDEKKPEPYVGGEESKIYA